MLETSCSPRTILLAGLLALGAGCVTPASGGESSGSDEKSAKEKEKEQELEQARLQLELAQFSAEDETRQARSGLEKAQRELQEAGLALARFREHERELKTSKARLDLDRAVQYLVQEEQELQQMEETYAAEGNMEATAERTRDIVLGRHRKQVEFAKRALKQEEEELADLESRELPREERERQHKVVAAEVELKDAESKLHKAEVDGRLEVMKARAKVEKLERGAKDGDGESDEGEES